MGLTRWISGQSRRDDDVDDTDAGKLVRNLLSKKQELSKAEDESTKATKTEKSGIILRKKARSSKSEAEQKAQIQRLRDAIQTVVRSTDPLGKVMDYNQEDLDSMFKEYEHWNEEYDSYGAQLADQTEYVESECVPVPRGETALTWVCRMTSRSLEPLVDKLAQLDEEIAEQLGMISMAKANVLNNDRIIEQLLSSTLTQGR